MQQTKFSSILFLFCLTITLSSCFEIIEEITIYPNGKGKAGLTVNLSQGKTKLSSIMLMDSIKGQPVPTEDEIKTELIRAKKLAASTPGIHKVEMKTNFNDFIFEMYCDFDSVEALNHFVNKLESHYTRNKVDFKKLFTFDNNTYYRNADYLIPNKHKEEITKEKPSLQNARYVSIVRLPREVVSISNKKANLAKNKKAIMLRVNGVRLLEQTNSITNKVIIKSL